MYYMWKLICITTLCGLGISLICLLELLTAIFHSQGTGYCKHYLCSWNCTCSYFSVIAQPWSMCTYFKFTPWLGACSMLTDTYVLASDWKSSPVSVFDLQGLRLRLRLVHQSPNTSKNQTGLIKDCKKPIKTGLDWLLVLTSLKQFKTSLSLKIRHIFISNFFEVNLSFKMSPRMLNMVGNWIFYNNIQ